MTNRKIIIYCLLTSLMLGCGLNSNKKNERVIGNPIINDVKPERPYSNPCNIAGSSYGSFFQSLHRNSRFELMIAFTSSLTLKNYGKENVLEYYKNKFQFDYKLGRLNNITTIGDTIVLSYSKAFIYASRRLIKLSCKIENDSVKLLLKELKRNPFVN